jgi:hypothetical protein
VSFSKKTRAVAVATLVAAGFVALGGVAGAKSSSDDGGGDQYGGAPITPSHDVFPAGVPVAGTVAAVTKAGSALPDGSSSGDSGNSLAGGG